MDSLLFPDTCIHSGKEELYCVSCNLYWMMLSMSLQISWIMCCIRLGCTCFSYVARIVGFSPSVLTVSCVLAQLLVLDLRVGTPCLVLIMDMYSFCCLIMISCFEFSFFSDSSSSCSILMLDLRSRMDCSSMCLIIDRKKSIVFVISSTFLWRIRFCSCVLNSFMCSLLCRV